jgi:signal recognition particle receptor subunit beta
MGVLDRKTHEIHAKIVLYGPAEAGTTTNLKFIHRKLKRSHRGDLGTKGSGSGAYEFLPVNLGPIRGYQTSIHVCSVPAGAEHATTRRNLLDGVDGVVFVADLRPHRHKATLESLKELESSLRHHGLSVGDVAVVLQYNHRDEVQENAVDALHRAIWLEPSAAFEAVASDGTGVLLTLTTLSKLILGRLRRQADHSETPVEPAVLAPEEPSVVARVTGEFDIPLAADAQLNPESKGFRVESGGPVEGTERDLRVPIVLVDEESGRKIELSLRLSLEPR